MESLKKELEIAKGFHRVAVRERDSARLQNEVRGRRITFLENLLKKHGIDWRKELPTEGD
jgi:hypothetical protein